MFVDEVKVYARAGHGGRGCVAFRREAYIPKGGPDGGNGGVGGDVILEATHDLNNLLEQFFNPRLLAPNGQNGMGKGMDGKAGKDTIIKVPCGTLVWRMQDTTPEADPTSRAASTLISLLGLRFLLSSSDCVFSSSGQSRARLRVSGSSTHRSAWVRTSIAWQLAHWPQAP